MPIEVPALQLPKAPIAPTIDWSPLSAIGDTIAANRRQDAIQGALDASTVNGQLDPTAASTALAKAGFHNEARQMLTLSLNEKHARATEAAAAEHNAIAREAMNKSGFHFAEPDFPGGAPRIYRTSPASGNVEEVQPNVVPGAQPQPGSTAPIVPKPVATESVPPPPVQQPAATAKPPIQTASEPPAEPPKPQEQAPQFNDAYLRTLPPEAAQKVRDINERPELLKDYYKGDPRLEAAVRRYNPSWTPPHIGFSPETISVNAHRMELGDFEWAKGLGRGGQTGRDITAVQNQMTDNLLRKGYTMQEAGQYLSRRMQEFRQQQAAMSAAGRTEGTREANLDMIIRAADAAIPAALEESRNVWRTGFVPLNKMVAEGGRIITSNPAERIFAIANLQLAEHWARAMNPLGVMRESDRDLALKMLSTADSPQTYAAAVGQVRKQIGRESDAIRTGRPSVADQIRKDVEARIRGEEPTPRSKVEPAANVPKFGERELAGYRANPTAALSKAQALLDQGVPADQVKAVLDQVDPSLWAKMRVK